MAKNSIVVIRKLRSIKGKGKFATREAILYFREREYGVVIQASRKTLKALREGKYTVMPEKTEILIEWAGTIFGYLWS